MFAGSEPIAIRFSPRFRRVIRLLLEGRLDGPANLGVQPECALTGPTWMAP
jgi:hypothetical protein